jgi:hypothetical protein
MIRVAIPFLFWNVPRLDFVSDMLGALAPAIRFQILLGAILKQTGVMVGEYIIIGQPRPNYPSVDHPVLL